MRPIPYAYRYGPVPCIVVVVVGSNRKANQRGRYQDTDYDNPCRLIGPALADQQLITYSTGQDNQQPITGQDGMLSSQLQDRQDDQQPVIEQFWINTGNTSWVETIFFTFQKKILVVSAVRHYPSTILNSVQIVIEGAPLKC